MMSETRRHFYHALLHFGCGAGLITGHFLARGNEVFALAALCFGMGTVRFYISARLGARSGDDL